jgi:hypothetical protein
VLGVLVVEVVDADIDGFDRRRTRRAKSKRPKYGERASLRSRFCWASTASPVMTDCSMDWRAEIFSMWSMSARLSHK